MKLEAEIERLREVKGQKLSKEAQKLMNMPHRRAITKRAGRYGQAEEKRPWPVVVHPMTELGREMGLKEMTGFVRPRSDRPPAAAAGKLSCKSG